MNVSDGRSITLPLFGGVGVGGGVVFKRILSYSIMNHAKQQIV